MNTIGLELIENYCRRRMVLLCRGEEGKKERKSEEMGEIELNFGFNNFGASVFSLDHFDR